MILGQSDHLLSRIRNIEIHFILYSRDFIFIPTELDKTNKNVASLISLLRFYWDVFWELYWKTFHWLKIFLLLYIIQAHTYTHVSPGLYVVLWNICYSFTPIQIKVPKIESKSKFLDIWQKWPVFYWISPINDVDDDVCCREDHSGHSVYSADRVQSLLRVADCPGDAPAQAVTVMPTRDN